MEQDLHMPIVAARRCQIGSAALDVSPGNRVGHCLLALELNGHEFGGDYPVQGLFTLGESAGQMGA